MKVLQILGSLHRGGAETMIMNYYRAFDKSLCQMDFVIHARYENDYCLEAEGLGSKIILIDKPGDIGVFKYISNLKKVIKEYGPYDAIHIHTNYQAFMSVISARQSGIKNIIVHSHSTNFSKLQIFVNRIILNFFRTKKVACGKAAGDAFFGKNKYLIINNAINISKFYVHNNEYDSFKKTNFKNKYVIGTFGRLVEPKNHNFLIDVAEEVVKKNTNVLFLIFGEGELQSNIEKKIRDKNLGEYINLMGVTNNVIPYYHCFDLFVLPSLSEGFPVTLIEAQAAGVFSFASDKISQECDLDIGLIHFLPLDINIWATEILNRFNMSNHLPIEDLANKMKPYDVNVQWINLYNLYCDKS